MNPWYTKTFDVTPGNRVGSQRVEDEFQTLQNAFDLLVATHLGYLKIPASPVPSDQLMNLSAASRANKYVAFDSSGNATAVSSIDYSGASATSLVIGTGAKSLTATVGKQWTVGQFLTLASAANVANYMHGQVTAYDTTTGAMSFTSTDTGGSGTFADWVISVAGSQGTSGTRTTTETLENKTLLAPMERVVPNTTALNGAVNVDLGLGSVHNFTTNSTANFIPNFRWASGTSLDAHLATDDSITVAMRCKMGATAYYPTSVKIDGSTVTVEWLGGAAPTSGNINSRDVYSFTIIKTAAATFSVLGTQAKFA